MRVGTHTKPNHGRSSWWIESGSIAFDFAYTGGFPGPAEWEHWHVPAELSEWWLARFDTELAVNPSIYRRARELRSAIAQAVTAVSRTREAVASLGAPERVKVCGADDCAIMYLDTSRSGNRVWCSMQRCGR